jgi:predicted ATP-dependent serine protease
MIETRFLLQVLLPRSRPLKWRVTVTGCIRELRTVLNDNAKQPWFIETIPTRGYRIIGKVVSSQHSVVSRKEEKQKAKSERQRTKGGTVFPAPNPQHPTPVLVGRETELAQLHQWLGKAHNGERQVVFVTGEPGIGKTTLIEAFLQSLVSSVQGHEEYQKSKRKRQKKELGTGS